MTATAHLALSLLNGETVSIMTGFKKFLITNIPREVGRSIERKFGVRLQRVPVKFVSTYGHSGQYFRYTLLAIRENKDGIKRMKAYVKSEIEKKK